MRTALAVIAAVAIVGCSRAGAPAATPEPTPRPTPAPTASPWRLAVVDNSYTAEAGVGDTIALEITISNTGTGANPATDVNFSELDKYADLLGCTPDCSKEDLPGLGPSAILPGVAPGATEVYRIEFVAKTVGVADWSVCVNDDELGVQVWCGDASTAIR